MGRQAHHQVKVRLVRLNPLTLGPGEFFVMCGRNLEGSGAPAGVSFTQFPARLEVLSYEDDDGKILLEEEAIWRPVEFTNEFQPDKSDDAREVRPEVQVPVYSKSTGNKRSGGKKRG